MRRTGRLRCSPSRVAFMPNPAAAGRYIGPGAHKGGPVPRLTDKSSTSAHGARAAALLTLPGVRYIEQSARPYRFVS